MTQVFALKGVTVGLSEKKHNPPFIEFRKLHVYRLLLN